MDIQQEQIRLFSLMSIVESDPGKNFVMLSEAKEELKKLKGQRCFLICICGTASTGKSTLLNLLIERFTGKYQEIFPIGDSNDATTKGIQMVIVEYEDDYLIFLDTQGCADLAQRDETQWISNVLMLIASSCSFTFFNFSGNKPDTVAKHLIQSEFSFYFLRRDANLTSDEEKQKLSTYLGRQFKNVSEDKVFLISPPSGEFQVRLKGSKEIQNGNIDESTKTFLEKIEELSKSVKDKLEQVPYLQSGEKIVEKLEALANQVPYYKDNYAPEYEMRIKTITEYTAKKIQILQKMGEIEREHQKELIKYNVKQNGIKEKETIAQVNTLFRKVKSLSVIAHQGLYLIDELTTFISNPRPEAIDLVYFLDTYVSPLKTLIFEDLKKILDGIGAANDNLGMTKEEMREMKDAFLRRNILLGSGVATAGVELLVSSIFFMCAELLVPNGLLTGSYFYYKKGVGCQMKNRICKKDFAELRLFIEQKLSTLSDIFENNFRQILDLEMLTIPLEAVTKEFLSINERAENEKVFWRQ